MPTESHLKLPPIQGLFLIYLVLIGLLTANVAALMSHNPVARSWALGDWLISYQGGPVRRGLPGEWIRLVSSSLHISSASTLLVAQISLYAVLFLSVWKLLRRSSWPYWVIALAFSPATLSFQLLDPLGGFRKEIFFLAGLGVLLCLLADHRASDTFVSLYLALLLGASTLSHEVVLCYLPYFAAAIAIMRKDAKRVLRMLAAPALLTLAAAAFVALHPGSTRVADSLCSSLTAQPADLADVCGGAIKHLADTPAQARDGVRRLAQTPSAFRIYGLRLALALLPVVGGFLQLWQSRHVRRPLLLLGAAGILSAVASIPLFLYAIDWGRWLYIHIVCLALLLFVIDRERRRGDAIPTVQSSTTTTPILRLAGACALLLYALTWNLPHVATDPNRDGYVGLLRSAISSKSS